MRPSEIRASSEEVRETSWTVADICRVATAFCWTSMADVRLRSDSAKALSAWSCM